MAIEPLKMTLGQAKGQGCTHVTLWCLTPRTTPHPYGAPTHVCGHHVDLDIDPLIARLGAGVSLSHIPAVCTVCGGRQFDARGWWKPTSSGGWPKAYL